MIGLVMAGGRGTRMAGGEKLAMGGASPLVLRAVGALADSGLCSRIVAAVSAHSPLARRLMEDDARVEAVETRGAGYAADLSDALRGIDGEAVIVPADMPLLDGDVLRRAAELRADRAAWTCVAVSAAFCASLGQLAGESVASSRGRLLYTGVSFVDARLARAGAPVREEIVVLDDARVALNANTRADYSLSEGAA